MPRLPVAVGRRIDEVARALGTVRDGEGPGLRTALPELRALLESDVAVTYGITPTPEGIQLEYVWARGVDVTKLATGFQEILRRTPRFGYYDPFCPEPSQRNRVDRRPSVPSHGEGIRRLYAGAGLLDKEQLRVLLCEGDSLLAWIGTMRAGSYGAGEQDILGRLVEPLRRRALLDRHLAQAPAALQLLGAAMEAIGAPAYLLRRGTIVHANASGRARLASDRGGTLELLRAHLDGRATGGYTLTRHQGPGLGDHVLAVAARPRTDPAPRAAALAARWGLTPAQERVLALVATGASNKAVAASLRCAESTVEFHLTTLLARTECEGRAALVARFWSEE